MLDRQTLMITKPVIVSADIFNSKETWCSCTLRKCHSFTKTALPDYKPLVKRSVVTSLITSKYPTHYGESTKQLSTALRPTGSAKAGVAMIIAQVVEGCSSCGRVCKLAEESLEYRIKELVPANWKLTGNRYVRYGQTKQRYLTLFILESTWGIECVDTAHI